MRQAIRERSQPVYSEVAAHPERGARRIAGYHADGSRTVNMQSSNWKGIDVINAHERQPVAYVRALRQALDCARTRGLVLASLHTHTWPLERAAAAFAAMEDRPAGFLKAVVYP